MVTLIFEELEERNQEDRFVIGFRMRKSKNWKYRYVSLHKITNMNHEEYGNWILLSRNRQNEIFEFKEEGIARCREILQQKKQDIIDGKINWWTGKEVE